MSYIYLVQTRESIKLNESIYKIGKTKRIGLERFTSYPKGSDLLFHIACPDCDILEKHLIDEFKNKYTQITDYGTEYFKGDSDKMIDNIFSLVKKQKDACKKVNIKIETEQNSVVEAPQDEPSNNLITENKGKIQNLIIKATQNEPSDNIIAENKQNKVIKQIQNKLFNCLECSNIFKTANGLWKHNKKYHNIKVKQIKKESVCEYCDKKLSDRHSKWRHEQICKNTSVIKNKNILTAIKTQITIELNKKTKQVDIDV
jgi:hypothetical protein